MPPDAFTRGRPALGEPALRLARASRASGFRWWIERFRRTFDLVDLTRVDHFRGFVAYWAVPADATTARSGGGAAAPAASSSTPSRAELGDLPVIAEDLGVITPAVERLRDELGLPGMHVLQWAFADRPSSPHRLENHRENGVVYTGTHDNDTTAGWWSSLERRRARNDRARPGRARRGR